VHLLVTLGFWLAAVLGWAGLARLGTGLAPGVPGYGCHDSRRAFYHAGCNRGRLAREDELSAIQH
jgi:hypothetical protein